MAYALFLRHDQTDTSGIALPRTQLPADTDYEDIENLRERYTIALLRRALAIIAKSEYIASLVAWLLVLAAGRFAIDDDHQHRFILWMSYGLAGVIVLTFVCFAPISLGRRRGNHLLAVLGPPTVSVDLDSQVVSTTEMLRLSVTNNAPLPHSFRASATSTNIEELELDCPWEIPWAVDRGFKQRIDPNGTFYLNVGTIEQLIMVEGRLAAGGLVFIRAGRRSTRSRSWHATDSAMTIDLQVCDARTGAVVWIGALRLEPDTPGSWTVRLVPMLQARRPRSQAILPFTQNEGARTPKPPRTTSD